MRAKVGEIRAFLNQVGEEDDEMEMASDGESEASGDEEVAAQGAIVPAPSEAAPAAAPVAAPAAAPAAAPPPAPVEVTATAVLDDPQTKTAYQRSLGKVNKQLALSNTECTRLKQANATLAHALRQRGIELPEGALYVSGTHDTHVPDATAGAGTGVPLAPPVVERAPLDAGRASRSACACSTCPTRRPSCTPKRFGTDKDRWPHCLDIYNPKQDLAPCTEKRIRQFLQFQLYDKRDGLRQVTETHLRAAHEARDPVINFRLHLVYDDDPSTAVTIDNLAEYKCAKLTQLSMPNIIGTTEEPMCQGKVTFRISALYVMAGHTEPSGRKFRWRIECVAPRFTTELDAYSPGFYNVSKSKLKQLETPRKRGNAASTAAR